MSTDQFLETPTLYASDGGSAVHDGSNHSGSVTTEGLLQPDPERTEAERIDPQPQGPLVLKSGTEVEISPMNLRETMKLLRIITHGAGGYVGALMDGLNVNDPAGFATTLATVVVMSFPDAEAETVEFLQSMVVPAGLKDIADAKERQDRIDQVKAELHNPSLGDFTMLVEAIIKRESEDIRGLGKRLGAVLNLAARQEDVNSAKTG